MMKKAIIIHGTEGYPEENWFPWLKKELEQRDYKVSVPQFPSPPGVLPKISEWFEVLKDYEIDGDTLLIAHSLGGLFALRVLEKLDHPVKAAFFAGASVGVKPIKFYDGDLAFSGGFDFDWDKIRNNAGHFVVFHSDDDPYVSLANGEKLSEELGVKLNFVPNAGHFNATAGYTEFPDLLKTIIDKEYMDIAIELSKKAMYPYGSIIVKDGQIIGRSDANTPVSKTQFGHAEIIAIDDAMEHLGGHLCAEGGQGVTIYSSCEPCAMCMGAILYTGIERLVYGANLDDSKECVNEILAKAEDVANACTNRKIKITPEYERKQAVKVLKHWRDNN